jgi:hypothetical protein
MTSGEPDHRSKRIASQFSNLAHMVRLLLPQEGDELPHVEIAADERSLTVWIEGLTVRLALGRGDLAALRGQSLGYFTAKVETGFTGYYSMVLDTFVLTPGGSYWSLVEPDATPSLQVSDCMDTLRLLTLLQSRATEARVIMQLPPLAEQPRVVKRKTAWRSWLR